MAASTLEPQIVSALRTVRDPEIPINIYDLGLIYGMDISPAGKVVIRMTLTSPACPVAGTLPGQIESKIRAIAGVSDVEVALVWDPPWSRERMSAAAKLAVGLEDPGSRQPFVPLSALERRRSHGAR
jgi:FeS assembly SUF system protein